MQFQNTQLRHQDLLVFNVLNLKTMFVDFSVEGLSLGDRYSRFSVRGDRNSNVVRLGILVSGSVKRLV